MTRVPSSATAPGKLMLSGEYAVVEGYGPAVAVALSKTIEVTVEEARAPMLTSHALGLVGASVEAVPVLVEVFKRCGMPNAHVIVQSELGAGPTKPGFGSSAALCVAALKALRSFTRMEEPTLKDAVESHRNAQGGAGSGYDVATAWLGGVCVYSCQEDCPSALSMPWCSGLQGAVLFTGRGAKTTSHLDKLERVRRLARPPALAALQRVGSASSSLAAAWSSGGVTEVLDMLKAAEAAAANLDAVAGLGIRQGGVAQAAQLIEGVGAVARTSGAGGGDCIWAFTDDPERLGRAVRAAEAGGFKCIDVGWPAAGAFSP